MSNLPHRIRKLHCLVSTGSQTEAFAIRQNLHDRWQDTLLPAFENAFDEITGSDRIIHIPKLELHIKVTSEQELLDVLPELIQQQLKEQLQSINLQSISTTPTQSGEVWQEITAQQNQFEILMHYLRRGSLLWQVSYASTSEIAIDLKETCRQQRSQLVTHLQNQPEIGAFYFRLFQLLPETEVLEICLALSDRFAPEWGAAITEFIRFVSTTGQRHLNQTTQWQLVADILSASLSQSPQQLRYNLSQPHFSRVVDKVISQLGINRADFLAFLPANALVLFQTQPNSNQPDTLAISPPDSENYQIISASSATMRSPLDLDLDTSLDSNSFENRDTHPNRYIESGLPNLELVLPIEINLIDNKFSLFVNYAGLVLIHPFISPLFEATGIKETNSYAIADVQMSRAAALLHFLATGQEEIYEYELGLIKILLGLEPETPVLVGAGLIQDSDREEAETVLQSAISYWTVLGNTSTDGIRSSFLQRSGLLRKTEDGWSLNVEHQSFDMLLEQLPWTISIIKLSWMKYPLYTEWQTF